MPPPSSSSSSSYQEDGVRGRIFITSAGTRVKGVCGGTPAPRRGRDRRVPNLADINTAEIVKMEIFSLSFSLSLPNHAQPKVVFRKINYLIFAADKYLWFFMIFAYGQRRIRWIWIHNDWRVFRKILDEIKQKNKITYTITWKSHVTLLY